MAINTPLREARLRAHMSQDDLARMIREAGFRSGDPNGCNRAMVHKWETGKVRRPQPRYLLALENVLGQPVASLGFADADLGVDRSRALSEAGLDSVLPLPEPAARYGSRSGIWRSEYDYHSSSRGQTFTGKHHVIMLERGARLMVRSLPASRSQLSMDLSVNGQVVTGTWAEETAAEGYYRGAVYYGVAQMIEDPDARRMTGKWVGFGRGGEVNDGAWRLILVDSDVGEAAVSRWNQEPE